MCVFNKYIYIYITLDKYQMTYVGGLPVYLIRNGWLYYPRVQVHALVVHFNYYLNHQKRTHVEF